MMQYINSNCSNWIPNGTKIELHAFPTRARKLILRFHLFFIMHFITRQLYLLYYIEAVFINVSRRPKSQGLRYSEHWQYSFHFMQAADILNFNYLFAINLTRRKAVKTWVHTGTGLPSKCLLIRCTCIHFCRKWKLLFCFQVSGLNFHRVITCYRKYLAHTIIMLIS